MNTSLSFHHIKRKMNSARVVFAPFDPLNMGKRIHGQLDIQIDGLQVKIPDSVRPVRTPGGRIAFFSLHDGIYCVSVNTTYYLKKQLVIKLPDDIPPEGTESKIDEECTYLSSKGVLLVKLLLLPSPVYLFAAGATLLRVRVFILSGGNEVPASGAEIYAIHNEESTLRRVYVTRSDLNGQAALCCNRMTRNRVLQINGFSIDGPKEFTLEAIDPVSGGSSSVDIEIKEFRENTVDIKLPG